LEHYTLNQPISFATRLDPGLDRRDFAEARWHLDRMPDRLFVRYGLSPGGRGESTGKGSLSGRLDVASRCPGRTLR
jgi:hypothetical protein